MRKVLLLVSLLTLQGCLLTSFDVIEENLDEMYGEPMVNVIDKLGWPDEEGSVRGRTFYTWERVDCRLRIYDGWSFDDEETIGYWKVRGNDYGCRSIANDLKP